jgi:peptide chain release factor 2
MRADAQAYVDRIDAALALIKTALNWDVALRRLDELNARVEDPTLWDDQSAAQAVMTERRRLDESISAAQEIQQERDDALEFIEMAEEEGDAALADEGAATLEKLATRADRDKVKALLSGEADGLDT